MTRKPRIIQNDLLEELETTRDALQRSERLNAAFTHVALRPGFDPPRLSRFNWQLSESEWRALPQVAWSLKALLGRYDDNLARLVLA